MSDQPERNRQAGRKIGSRQPDVPVVEHGHRDDADVAADPNMGMKVRFSLPIQGKLPPDETTHPDGPPTSPGRAAASDLREPADESSVWDAREDDVQT